MPHTSHSSHQPSSSSSTHNPSSSTSQPSTSTAQNPASSHGPTDSTSQNPTSSNKPSDSKPQNPSSTNKPSDTAPQDPASTTHPSTSTQQNPASTQHPSSSTQQDPASTHQPNTSTSQNPAATNKPGTGDPGSSPLATNLGPRRRIIACCDGTKQDALSFSNETSQTPPKETNVFRFLRLVTNTDADGRTQYPIYQRGLGSAKGNLSVIQRLDRSGGRIFGYGISDNIAFLYRRICMNCRRGDIVSFLGFSRGAFTARCVADLVGTIGILEYPQRNPRANTNQDQESTWLDNAAQLISAWQNQKKALVQKAQIYLRTQHQRFAVEIDFCAVWDTVAAIGAPKVWGGRIGPQGYKGVAEKLHYSVQYGFQALALNESRGNFGPMVWPDLGGHQEIKQVWFPGVHPSIGGGSSKIPNQAVANVTLKWIATQVVQKCGIGLNEEDLDKVTAPPPGAEGRIPTGTTVVQASTGTSARVPGQPSTRNQTIHRSMRDPTIIFPSAEAPSTTGIFLHPTPTSTPQGFVWLNMQQQRIMEEEELGGRRNSQVSSLHGNLPANTPVQIAPSAGHDPSDLPSASGFQSALNGPNLAPGIAPEQ